MLDKNIRESLITETLSEIETKKTNSWDSIIFMNIFCVCLSLYSILAKEALSYGITVLHLNFIRCCVCASIGFSCMLYRGNTVFKDVQPHNRKYLVIRSLAGQLSYYLITLTMDMIPLSTIFIIFNTNQFFASALSFFINKEPIFKSEVFSMLVCFLCVYMLSE